jgi:hypothetical protein
MAVDLTNTLLTPGAASAAAGGSPADTLGTLEGAFRQAEQHQLAVKLMTLQHDMKQDSFRAIKY